MKSRLTSWFSKTFCVQLLAFTQFVGVAFAAVSAPVTQPIMPAQITPSISAHQRPTTPESKQVWNLKNADIRAVIQTISLLTGKNFIIDPRVNGRVTLVSQKPMTTDELYHVFLSLLQTLNFAAVPSGHVIKIVPAMNAKTFAGVSNRLHPAQGDAVVVRVVPVSHVSASQLVPVVRPLMHQWGSVSAYMPSNSLILTGSASNIVRLVGIVHRLDGADAPHVAVVTLKHANAKQVVQVIKSLQMADRAQGKVSNVSLAADTQNNSILVSGNLANQIVMRNLIHRLDRKNSSMGNTVVIHLDYLDAKKLAPVLSKIAKGVDLDVTQNTRGVALNAKAENAAISVQAEESRNAVVIHAPVSIIQNLRAVIRKLDVQPQEVLVQAIIVKVDESLLNQLGVVWNTVDSSGNAQGPNDNTAVFKLAPSVGFINGGSLQVLVHALQNNSSTDILSTPSVVVVNNEEATISDGKNIGIVNRQYSTNVADNANTTVPFNTIERKDVTLSLKVTPQISPNQTLRLKIDQQNNSLDPNAQTSPDNPTIDTSKIATSVMVHSGDILVLGGLINNNLQKGDVKVPILGSIPLVGHLFRYKNHSIEKQNLMVFIRPVILNSRLKRKRETLHRYNYLRHQQLVSQGDVPLTEEDMPVLPRLTKQHLPPLPPPTYTEHP